MSDTKDCKLKPKSVRLQEIELQQKQYIERIRQCEIDELIRYINNWTPGHAGVPINKSGCSAEHRQKLYELAKAAGYDVAFSQCDSHSEWMKLH